jgi:hypothetical protein
VSWIKLAVIGRGKGGKGEWLEKSERKAEEGVQTSERYFDEHCRFGVAWFCRILFKRQYCRRGWRPESRPCRVRWPIENLSISLPYVYLLLFSIWGAAAFPAIVRLGIKHHRRLKAQSRLQSN